MQMSPSDEAISTREYPPTEQMTDQEFVEALQKLQQFLRTFFGVSTAEELLHRYLKVGMLRTHRIHRAYSFQKE